MKTLLLYLIIIYMYNYSKFLSAICAGMLLCGASMPMETRASEAVAQAKATVQVKGVVLDTSDQPIIGASVIETSDGQQDQGLLHHEGG